MRRRSSFLTLVSAAWVAMLAGGHAAHAGGPLLVTREGRPFTWDRTRPVAYTMDRGKLGRFSNAQVSGWVAEAFRRWGAVDGVNLSAQATSPYDRDITGENILEVLDMLPDDVNLIILDDDGTVLDTLFGAGSRDQVSGRGGPRLLDPGTATIVQGMIFLNGYNSDWDSAEWYQRTIQHEVGHLLGLTHSQLNPHVQYDGDPTNDALAPCMSYADGPNGRPTLHLDDRAWIAALYPNMGAAPTTGTIRGRVLLPDGKTGLQGIQVVARRDGDEELTAVSGISGYLYKHKWPSWIGSRDVGLQGSFEIPGLPPGNYRLAIEQLEDVPVVDPRHAFLPGGRRFWRESGPLATQPQDATLVAVSAGQVLAGKDFVLEGPAPPPHEVPEVRPSFLPETAQTLPLPAIVTGHLGPRDPSFWEVPLPDGRRDRVEVWHRVVVAEPTTLSATLTAANPKADLNLYLASFVVNDGSRESALSLWESSTDPRTPPETVQVRVPPGVYFVGVSRADSARNPASDYRLTVLGTPSPDLPQAAPNPPRITLATIGDLKPESLRVSWQTDQEANSMVFVGPPTREVGSPALTREHSVEVTGLSPATGYFITIRSRNESGERAFLGGLPVTMPSAARGSGPRVSGGLWSLVPQGEKDREFLLVARVANVGDGPATHVRIDRLELPAGWSFTARPALPLELGEIGSQASALLAVRVTRAADAAPPDLILEGSYASPDGSARPLDR
jgi:hypothetical protein